eukprot:gene17857-17925_t
MAAAAPTAEEASAVRALLRLRRVGALSQGAGRGAAAVIRLPTAPSALGAPAAALTALLKAGAAVSAHAAARVEGSAAEAGAVVFVWRDVAAAMPPGLAAAGAVCRAGAPPRLWRPSPLVERAAPLVEAALGGAGYA